jgi:hypothetical protein
VNDALDKIEETDAAELPPTGKEPPAGKVVQPKLAQEEPKLALKEVNLVALNDNPSKFDGQTVTVRANISGTIYEGVARYRLTVKGAKATADGQKIQKTGINFDIPKDQKDRLMNGFQLHFLTKPEPMPPAS